MGVKVTGQFEPAGDFSIVDAKDVSGNITGSNILVTNDISGSATSTGSFGHLVIAGNITASGVVRADAFESVTGGDSIDFKDSITVSGNVTADNLTADSSSISTRLSDVEAGSTSKTLISGSAVQMEGQLAIWKSGVNKDYPCYECVFPKTAEVAPITNCREAGIIGPITGLIGSMQVNEGIKEIALKNYDSSAGYLFLYDGLVQSLDKIKLTKNKKCPVCSI